MTIIKEQRKTYKFRLYDNDASVHFHQQINVAGLVWNHGLALSRRYYRLYGKRISFNRLQRMQTVYGYAKYYARDPAPNAALLQQLTDEAS